MFYVFYMYGCVLKRIVINDSLTLIVSLTVLWCTVTKVTKGKQICNSKIVKTDLYIYRYTFKYFRTQIGSNHMNYLLTFEAYRLYKVVVEYVCIFIHFCGFCTGINSIY